MPSMPSWMLRLLIYNWTHLSKMQTKLFPLSININSKYLFRDQDVQMELIIVLYINLMDFVKNVNTEQE